MSSLAARLPLDIGVAVSSSGQISLEYPRTDGIPPLIQGPPGELSSAKEYVRGILDKLLKVSIPPTVADVSRAGHSWVPGFSRPTLWTSPSDPYATVEPVLPQEYASRDVPNRVSYQETTAVGNSGCHEPGFALALARRRRHSRQGTREYVRGESGSMPFIPGGESWVTTASPATAAAHQEAESGAWLSEVEGNEMLPRVLAPGMSCGAFGAWTTGEKGSLSMQKDEESVYEEMLVPDTDEAEKSGNDKMALDNLFMGVWLLEEEDEEEPVLENIENEEAAQGTSAEPDEAELDQVLALPDDIDLPGGVESGTLATTLGSGQKESSARDVLDGIGSPMPALTPAKEDKGLGSHKTKFTRAWAVQGKVRDLDGEWRRLLPGMAKRYPFELDEFQKEAIVHMEAGRSVFVAAHTSAGKTVAAEYALALATKHCTRAVYTSPIKTISNQKFRDFSGSFEVGLLTGDVSIRPDSTCLICTTEILRSMLYKGADVIRDIEWVIFDEVHYVNDAERGVVWEEVIIMLPEHVNLVLLSATVPNVMEFADWVGRTKRKVVHVTGTTKRPVPLEHMLYYSGKLYPLLSTQGYDSRGFRAAKEVHDKRHATPQTKAEAKAALPTGRGGGGIQGGRGPQMGHTSAAPSVRGAAVMRGKSFQQGGGSGSRQQGPQLRGERSQWSELIHMLRKQDLLPMVAFCFSKRRCDAIADALSSLDMTTATEKSEIHLFCDRALARLKGSDRELPQVLRVREMLKRGVGVHHAGLLPIVKEVVEMLFCRGIIKILFSTETFAMGVNAPARTVVFQALRKHDGRQFRTLLPGEYTQMAGRAGRRGLDAVGTVIIAAWDDLPDEHDVRRLLTGSATKLESQFRLTYSMILNLLRVEDLKIEDMLKRSFAEFHAQRAAPEAQEALRKGQAALKRLRARPWPISSLGTTREAVEEYAEVAATIETLGTRVQDAVMTTRGAISALSNGRVVLVHRPLTGVTEVGVVVDVGDAMSASKKKVIGSVVETQGDASTAAGRRKLILSLHRPSPLDEQRRNQSVEMSTLGPTSSTARAESPKPALIDGGMRVLKRKDDDDDFGFNAGIKKGGKGRGGVSLSNRPPISLPSFGSVGGASYVLAETSFQDISDICKSKIRMDAEGVSKGDTVATAAAVAALRTVVEEGDLALMDPIADLKVNTLGKIVVFRVTLGTYMWHSLLLLWDKIQQPKLFAELASDIRERQRLMAHLATMLPCHSDPLLPEMLAIVRSERTLVSRLAAIARGSGDAGLAQLPEFHVRVGVLQQMGYLDADRTVTMKGRVACEINSGDELVATELIFGGLLADLTPEEAVALLSALVFQDKSEVEPSLPPKLMKVRDRAAEVAGVAGEIQQEAGLDVVPDEFVRATLNFGLMEVVYEWAKGTPFAEICGFTDVMEGSIVRTMVRLDETCREFRDAARVMGDTALFRQMDAASTAIKRDIVFAASLYVS